MLELAAPTAVRVDPAISGFGVSVGIGVPEVVVAVAAAVVSGMGDLRFWPAAACIGACGWVCGVAEVDAPAFCSMRARKRFKKTGESERRSVF